jgi:hypothetical protein
MSGSSGMSSFSRWSCELTISISESVRDMVAMPFIDFRSRAIVSGRYRKMDVADVRL